MELEEGNQKPIFRKMSQDRRIFLKGLGGTLLLSLTDLPALLAEETEGSNAGKSLINFIIPPDYQIPGPASRDYQYKLIRATLDLLEEKFSEQPLPVWGKPFGQVDFEKRITNIVFWLISAIAEHQSLYPVDPAWIISQIMKESYFNEYAISSALAVGICQFIEPTATDHGMLCAGTHPEHHQPPYKLPELAGKASEYYRLRRERNEFRRNQRPAMLLTLDETLDIIRSGSAANYQATAAIHLNYLEELEKLNKLAQEARAGFREYLSANIEGRDIFNDQDVHFLVNFDERFTYKKPISAMVKMIARGLRARNGNILTSTVGYNAGLYSTIDNGMYKPYGKIPGIEESTTYLSHVLINYYEITSRME